MTYSHNAEADFAASELARLFAGDPRLCYAKDTVPSAMSAYASYEASSSPWPKPDGLVAIVETPRNVSRDVAVEYKRLQEGLHGVLTAIGQAHAYLHKGYNGAAIVIPSVYAAHPSPASYVTEVLDQVSRSKAIGVFNYEDPDTSSPTPFQGRLHSIRPLELVTARSSARPASARTRTQWVHMREGSTTRDAFLRFLQTATQLAAGTEVEQPDIPPALKAAVKRIAPESTPEAFLANTADDKFLSRVWRGFWFSWIATREVLTPWLFDGTTYSTPKAFTRIELDEGNGRSQIFEGRADGLKENLVRLLDAKEIDEQQGWEMFAAGFKRTGKQNKQGVRERAHSYREDLDSSLSHLQWIDNDGRPTDYGYRYMTTCDRYGGANSEAAIQYVGASLLQTGRYAAFLHYVHRLSERMFVADPLAFTRPGPARQPVFNENSYTEYLSDLESRFVDELRVMRKVSGRARPRKRTSFQAELTLLRNYGFVGKSRHRLGVGIPIDWEHVVEALDIEL